MFVSSLSLLLHWGHKPMMFRLQTTGLYYEPFGLIVTKIKTNKPKEHKIKLKNLLYHGKAKNYNVLFNCCCNAAELPEQQYQQ
jgi:hypothetical protein